MDMTAEARILAMCVKESHQRYGINVILDTVHGANNAKIRQYGICLLYTSDHEEHEHHHEHDENCTCGCHDHDHEHHHDHDHEAVSYTHLDVYKRQEQETWPCSWNESTVRRISGN